MNDDIAIKVEGVYKDFVLPHERAGSVKGIFTSMFRQATSKKEIQHALKHISFEIKKGEFFGIVGRNGSGKSTLLKILAGIYQPTKGKVYTKGKLVPFIELGVGFNPELTGRDNVYLNGAILGFSEKEIDSMYKEIVDFAELERFMDQKLKNYSSGMQVRLAFSMAVRANAEILLIDEVLAVGDADFQRKCFNYFKQLKNDKTTVVFVTHDMSAVREYCDRALLIEDSKVVNISTPDKIAQDYVKMFMDEPVLQEVSKKNDDRWGDGSIILESIKTKVNDEFIELDVVIKGNKDFSMPILGFRICSFAGDEITGTNTKKEKIILPNIKKGATVHLKCKIPNILSDGNYRIDTALQYPDEITVADWWDNAATISIRKDRHLPYSIDPGFIISII